MKGKDNQAKAAFVIFRSMEGAQRALNKFGFTSITASLLEIKMLFKCRKSKHDERSLFKDKCLIMVPAVEPDLV